VLNGAALLARVVSIYPGWGPHKANTGTG